VDQTINYRRKILFYAAASSCASVFRIARRASAPPGVGGLHRRAVLTALLAPRASAPRATAAAPPRAREPSVSASLAARRAAPRRAPRAPPRPSACSPSPLRFGAGSVGGLGGPAPQLKGAAGEKFTILSRRKLIRARAPATGRVCIVPRQLSHSVYGVGPTHTAKSVGCVHLLGESEDPAKVDISRMALLSRDRALHRRCCSWRLRASCQACRSCWSATAAHAQHHACAVLPAASSRAGAMQSFTRA